MGVTPVTPRAGSGPVSVKRTVFLPPKQQLSHQRFHQPLANPSSEKCVLRREHSIGWSLGCTPPSPSTWQPTILLTRRTLQLLSSPVLEKPGDQTWSFSINDLIQSSRRARVLIG